MTTLGTVYRSRHRRCNWCRLAIIPIAAGSVCTGCLPLVDLALRRLDSARDEALSYLVDVDEPEDGRP